MLRSLDTYPWDIFFPRALFWPHNAYVCISAMLQRGMSREHASGPCPLYEQLDQNEVSGT